MPDHYRVTNEDDAYELTFPSKPGKNWASDVSDAAQMWAERRHSDLDYPDSMTAIVTDPNGKRWRVDVGVETTPVFSTFGALEIPE